MKHRALIFLTLLWSTVPAAAQDLLMARSMQPFPEAMLALQNAISEHDYTVARVQRVDVGLTGSGHPTDKYRIVFFGKPLEIRQLSERYPQMIPYLPLKLTVFAEREETVMVAADPLLLTPLVDDEESRHLLARWRADLLSIMDNLRGTE